MIAGYWLRVTEKMWQIKNDIFSDDKFFYRNLVTTKKLGNLKDDNLRKIFCSQYSIDFGSLTTAEQVHDNKVAVVNENNKGQKIALCDGLITNCLNLPLAIFTADCIPIFLSSKSVPVIGIIHAGWRGLEKKIIEEAIKIFIEDFKVHPKDIFATLGPHIQKCCYEVSKELKSIFGLNEKENKLNLSSVAVKQLKEAGVKKISLNKHCTCHEPDMFFSYRREKTASRMMSLAVIEKINEAKK
ncbi:MAG: peptidoglycan editing factor PgeF [Elusimicrobia bacterium]|nr:peptidoglycan editing factor PgeF [Elusimicrobiota bacterium]